MIRIGSKTRKPIWEIWSLREALSKSSDALNRCSEASLDQEPVRWYWCWQQSARIAWKRRRDACSV